MKLLITGGTGFIGSRLALQARGRGIQAVVAGQVNGTAEKARAQELKASGVEVAEGSLQDPQYAATVTRGCNVVVHLAAAQHESNVPDAYFRAVNVDATRTLLQASAAAGVTRFVYGSTIGVYGAVGAQPVDEDSPARPANIYGRTKLEAEGVVRSFDALPNCIVRISETYGPGDFRLLKLFRALERGRFIIIGSGDNRHQLIHVADLVQLLLLAAEHPGAVGQTILAVGQEVLTTRQMVAQVARAVGGRAPRVRAPLWPFLALAVGMEVTLKPLGISPPLHRRRLDFFRKSFVFDTLRAQKLLGFAPRVPFTEGAAETAAWYRQHGYLGG
ncbi:MAG TPA: NAD-dependent epimerase/dehydratase family protein [Steroidobacteraceae bacterium]|jgi:nucleoside-diphosphate-sugar epimerase|nr:NAD-dependent epimerase/dehydratase family protein [Steroidobacteraceae bacterium]